MDPDNIIRELNELNNSFSRKIKVLDLPRVSIPAKSFISFKKNQKNPRLISIVATVGNLSNSRNYGFYLNDHAEATDVVVKFFDGNPDKKRQIGSDVVIDQLKPVEFKNASVDWDISKLSGSHLVYIQVFPGKNVIRALGPKRPSRIAKTIDLDAYRSCAEK